MRKKMRKNTRKILIPFLASLILLTGCQDAPEVASDGETLRAKGAAEEAVEDILNGDGGESTGEIPDGQNIKGESTEETDGKAVGASAKQAVNVVLGSGENRMKIEAEVPVVPKTLPIYTMQANSSLMEEVLREFLAPQGDVDDITERLLAEQEAEIKRVEEIDKKLGEGSSIVEIATIGDDSYLALSDGNRQAIFTGKTGVSYQDARLMEKFYSIAGNEKAETKDVNVKKSEAGDTAFSLQDAKAVLLQKLSCLGIEDINLYEAHSFEAEGNLYYDMQFSPSVDDIPVAYSFGQQELVEAVYPNGFAYVCADGVAEIGLWNFCMEQVSAEGGTPILSWNKVQELLEVYLDNGSLQCRENVPFSTAELVWYPELNGKELKLVPMWSIRMDLGEYVDYCGESDAYFDSVWNIYINGVSGELEKVQ